jgi:elongation factor G
MGNVSGDINSRRGVILGMDDSPSGKLIQAEVPLAEMFGYATALRSATQGRASYSMQFEKYQKAPKNVVDAIVNRY